MRAMPNLEEEEDEDSEEEEGEEEDLPDRVEWISSAHIEAMIIFVHISSKYVLPHLNQIDNCILKQLIIKSPLHMPI